MSIENLFADWTESQSDLLSTSVSTDDTHRLDIETAVQEAVDILSIESSEYEGYVIPLFRPNKPIPTNKHVVYQLSTDTLRWHDLGFGQTGAERRTDLETIARTPIADRLRYWLPEYQSELGLPFDDEELPPDNIYPDQDTVTESFFAELTEFVQTEQEKERERNREAYFESGFERLQQQNKLKGPFIPISKGSEGNYTLQYIQDEDESREDVDLFEDVGIHQNSFYLADLESADEVFPLEGKIVTVKDNICKLQPNWDSIDNRPKVEKVLEQDTAGLYLYQLLNPVPFERRQTAISKVKKNTTKSNLLAGDNTPISFTVDRFDDMEADLELNHHQKLAVLWAESAEDAVCIHGPPGTGKTRTLTAFVEKAVRRGQRVLVSAHSNQAVDNLLVGDSTLETPEPDTLHALAQQESRDLSIARIGDNSQNRVVDEYYCENSGVTADVIAATTSGAAHFDQNEFDIGVLDEATQASRPATSIVLNAAKKSSSPATTNNSLRSSLMKTWLRRRCISVCSNISSIAMVRIYQSNLRPSTG